MNEKLEILLFIVKHGLEYCVGTTLKVSDKSGNVDILAENTDTYCWLLTKHSLLPSTYWTQEHKSYLILLQPKYLKSSKFVVKNILYLYTIFGVGIQPFYDTEN